MRMAAFNPLQWKFIIPEGPSMRKTAWLMWEQEWLRGWQESDGKNEKPWSPSSDFVPFPPLSFYNQDWIPLLCPLIYWRAIFPCFTQTPPLVPGFFFPPLPLSLTLTLTLCMYLWQQWWELSRDTWLIQPCSFHTPLPPFLFYFTLLHPQTAGRQKEAAQQHVPRVQQASTYASLPPLPSHHTERYTGKRTHALQSNHMLLRLCIWTAHIYTHWSTYIANTQRAWASSWAVLHAAYQPSNIHP